ncbi:MAG: M13 family peptidase, partial [Ilyomonas sp.]
MKRILLYALLPGMCLLTQNDSMAQKGKSSMKYIDRENMDLSVKPGDNFYLYANGAWLKNNPVPASKTRWGSFDVLRQTSLERLKLLAEEAANNKNAAKGSVEQRVGDLYASAMDSTAIEKAGFTPIKPELERLASLTTKDEVLHEIATLRTKGIGGLLFGFYVGQDDKNVNEYIPGLSQGGTSLPDRDYYLKDDSRSKAVRSAYLSYVTDMFKLVGDDAATAEKKANAIMALETGLAKAQMSRVEMRDPQKTYNKFAVADFSKTTPGFDWKSLMAEMKVTSADSILVNNPTFF